MKRAGRLLKAMTGVGNKLDLPTMPHLLGRIAQHQIEVGSIISLGAGRGEDSADLFRHWPNAKMLLIEMDERFRGSFDALKQKHPNLSYEICAAAGEDRDGLQIKSDQFGGAIVSANSPKVADATAVKFRKLDSLATEHGLQPPYFLKFDTHGAELDILAGAENVLGKTSGILMEVYNFKLKFMDFKNLTFDEMSLHLKTLGFRCADLSDPMYRPGDQLLWQMHMLFLRSDHPAFERTSYSAPK
jgi:FkbM family methyltransferase